MSQIDRIIEHTKLNDPSLSIFNAAQKSKEEDFLLACENGQIERILEIICDGQLQINQVLGFNKENALHIACNAGRLDAVKVLLVKGKMNINSACKNLETPLHKAVYKGHLHICEYLIDFGVEINSINNYGDTPLFYAVRQKQAAIARLLVVNGGDTLHRNKFGDTVKDEVSDNKVLSMLSLGHCKSLLFKFNVASMTNIFSFLDSVSLCRVACVCTKWNRACDNKELWENLGVNRWSLSLQSTLNNGFPLPISLRPRSNKSNNNKKK